MEENKETAIVPEENAVNEETNKPLSRKEKRLQKLGFLTIAY
jgi:hypothetical protein